MPTIELFNCPENCRKRVLRRLTREMPEIEEELRAVLGDAQTCEALASLGAYVCQVKGSNHRSVLYIVLAVVLQPRDWAELADAVVRGHVLPPLRIDG